MGRTRNRRRGVHLHRHDEVDARSNQGSDLHRRIAQGFANLRADVSFALTDAVIVAFAYAGGLVLRFAERQGIEASWWAGFMRYLPVVVAVHLGANAAFGAYGHVWEFASVEEAMRLVAASALSVVSLAAGLIGIQAVSGANTRIVPMTVILLGGLLALCLMGATRFRSRMFSFRRTYERDAQRAVLIGSGREAADFARHARSAQPPTVVIGFVDDRENRRRLAGLPLLGSIDEIAGVVEFHQPDEVIIGASIGPERTKEVVDRCIDVDVRLRTLPDTNAILDAGQIGDVRDLELSDLLSRSAVTTDLAAVGRIIRGKRVLVTGAGGSIGSELVTQVLALDPSSVVALDNDEGHLYEAMLGWRSESGRLDAVLCDIRDERGLRDVFEEHRPQVLFHAAAHKHVPLLQGHPREAIKTNVMGTENLVRLAHRFDVERFVLISTDKAVEPSSVMGASKRIAELMVQSAPRTEGGTVFAAVRFGNVLGSRGSVVPTFMRQIQNGGPVTVSDPNMLRYFMLTSEAVELVLQAAAMAEGGEIFVLDMGDPVEIGDLARRMIRLSGLVPDRDIEVVVTGHRPGEKLSELLSHGPLTASAHPRIGMAHVASPGPATLHELLGKMTQIVRHGTEEQASAALMHAAWREWTGNEHIDLRVLETIRVETSGVASAP